MKLRTFPLAILAAVACLQAQAIGTTADVTIIDRVSGQTLPLYFYRGEYWVPGTPGATYSILVRSRRPQRVLAVPAVDGVNALSGETAAVSQSGYVLGAYRRYEITGWRKSSSEVAAFEFSDASNSYASRTGRPANVGVIGVALFEEAQPEPVAVAPAPPAWPAPAPGLDLARREAAPSGGTAGANSAPAAPAVQNQAKASVDAPAAEAAARSSMATAPPVAQLAPSLGTAHGQREYSRVAHTNFVRKSPQPNEVVRIRYDSQANLIALGVIPSPIPASPSPFPGTVGSYVPDPPARY